MHTVIYVIPFIASMEAVINDIDLKKMYIVTPTKKLAVAGQDRVPLPASSLKMSTEKKHTAAHLGSSPPPPPKKRARPTNGGLSHLHPRAIASLMGSPRSWLHCPVSVDEV